VAFVADQDAGRKGVFVDFFGRPASTYKSIALMAMQFSAPIVVGYGKRLGEDFRFELGVARVIEPHEWAGRDDPVRWITQEYTRALEETVRAAPEQYLWVHRRWKHRPKGEPQPEDGVA
jgi:KDO2-lipid IV(A) lauroyltransferase